MSKMQGSKKRLQWFGYVEGKAIHIWDLAKKTEKMMKTLCIKGSEKEKSG